MLAYAGIETKSIGEFVVPVAKKKKKTKTKKNIRSRDVKKAIAKNPGSNDTVYEVIYLDVIDPVN